MKKIFIYLLFHIYFLQGMQQPKSHSIPNLSQLCCKVLAHYYGKNIEEIDDEMAKGIEQLNQLGSDNLQELKKRLIPYTTGSQLLCTVPAFGQFNNDGSKLLVNTNDLAIYDTHNGTLLHRLKNSNNFFCETWSPLNNYIVATLLRWEKPYGCVWDANIGEILYTYNYSKCCSHTFTADDTTLIVKEIEKPWIIKDARTGKTLIELGEADNHYTPMIDPLSHYLILVHDQTSFYDAKTFQHLKSFNGKIKCFSPNNELMVLDDSTNQSLITVYNRALQLLKKILVGSNSPERSFVTFVKNNQLLFQERLYSKLFSLDGNMIKQLYHRDYSDKKEYFSNDCSKIFTIEGIEEKNNQKVRIAEGATILHDFELADISNVYYTANENCYFLGNPRLLKYIFNIQTGALTPINADAYVHPNIRSIDPKMSSDGKFQTEENNKVHIRQLIDMKTPLATIFALIVQKNILAAESNL